MRTKIFIIFVMLIFLNLCFSGCYAVEEVTFNDDVTEIIKAEMSDGTIEDFTKFADGVGYLSDNNIIAYKNDSTIVRYPAFSVKKMYAEKVQTDKTILAVTGITVLTGLLVGVGLGIGSSIAQTEAHESMSK